MRKVVEVEEMTDMTEMEVMTGVEDNIRKDRRCLEGVNRPGIH